MNLCTQCKHYGRGPYAIPEVCLLEEVEIGVSPVDGSNEWPSSDVRFFRGKAYKQCYIKRKEHPDCPDFEAPPPIKWWQIWRWGE